MTEMAGLTFPKFSSGLGLPPFLIWESVWILLLLLKLVLWFQPFFFHACSTAYWLKYQISYTVIFHLTFGMRQNIK